MARKKGKALVRKVSRKRALSYDRMEPNRRGVTALSEINGKDAYSKRYRQARALLRNGGRMAKKERELYEKQLEKGRTPKQAAAFVRMQMAKNGASVTPRSAIRRPTSKSAKKRPKTRRVMRPNLRTASGEKLTKAEYIQQRIDANRTPAQAEQDYKLASGYYKKRDAGKFKKRKQRRYGKDDEYKALKARVGDKDRWTYFYKTKQGNTRKIPDHALMGYESAAEIRRIENQGSDKEQERLRRRRQKLLDRRIRESRKAEERALAGAAWFSPNPSTHESEVLTFEEWIDMKKRGSRKKKATPNRSTRATGGKQAFIRSQMAKGRSRSQAEATWKLTQARKGGSKSTSRRGRKKTSGRRKTTARRARIRNLKKACRKVSRMKANPGRHSMSGMKKNARGKKRSSKRTARRGKHTMPMKANRRRPRRKGMRANQVGSNYRQELMNSFKFGAIVTGGFLTHRVLTNLVDTYALSKVDALQTGAIADFRKSISGLLVAAVGIPLTVRVLPRNAGVAAAGMAASYLYELILAGLKKANQPALLNAVSNYANAPGYPQYSGYGAYYTFKPHQVFNGHSGLGEYYETQPTPGLEQAAAGYGAMDPMMLTQAAAGYGQSEPMMLTQAAAGMQQMAANQVGEYYAYDGMQGIGEYETVETNLAGFAGSMDDGVMPNLQSADQALDVSEAAAGLGEMHLSQAAAGFGDVPLQSTVSPTIRALDIPDHPGGSRAGLFQGGDGIFG